MLKNTLIAASVAMLGLAVSSQAGIIGNGPPNQSGGSDLNSFIEADNFSLASESIITQVEYWTLQIDGTDYAGTTDWGFYTDASGVPGTALAFGNVAAIGVPTGNTTLGLNEFAYTFGLGAGVDLAAGNYWLVLHNGPSTAMPPTNYYWAWSSDAGDSQSQFVGDTAWNGNLADLAFQLTTTSETTTPEPASITLVGCGLLAAWFVRRKMHAKA